MVTLYIHGIEYSLNNIGIKSYAVTRGSPSNLQIWETREPLVT